MASAGRAYLAGRPRLLPRSRTERPGAYAAPMAYTSAEGRDELLDGLAQAIDEIALALAALGAAYEQVDEYSGDRLERELFRPGQAAYAKAKRAYAGFAARHGAATRAFEDRSPGLPSTGGKGFIEKAAEAATSADAALASLQDSPLLVDVGDRELRDAIANIRTDLAGIRGGARELVRTLGR